MTELQLKSGLEARIDVWSFQQFEDFLKSDPPIDDSEARRRVVEGFTYLSLEHLYHFSIQDPDNDYNLETTLSPLEFQAIRHSRREEYHQAIVATIDDTLVGMILCQWVKFRDPSWHYHLRFVDVHDNFKNQGIATALFQNLDEADFIKDKILQVGMLSGEGRRYIRETVLRELQAKDYVLIFEDYDGPSPTQSGIHGGTYW